LIFQSSQHFFLIANYQVATEPSGESLKPASYARALAPSIGGGRSPTTSAEFMKWQTIQSFKY